MKRILLIFFLLLIASNAIAKEFCQRGGVGGMEAINCKTVRFTPSGEPYIMDGSFRISTVRMATARDWYELVVTPATLGTDQVTDEIVWGFEDNKITKTWTARDMTADEIDARDGAAMSLELYTYIKWQIAEGNITPNTAPADLKKAYLARQRLEQ